MKNLKVYAIALSCLVVLAGCDLTNSGKGTIFGGTGGAVLGGIVGNLIGKDAKGTAIGAAVGTAVGAGAGYLIGKKMDKAKAAAQAVANADVQSIQDANGLDALKVTFDSGLLFATGSSNLSASAKRSLDQFASQVLVPNADFDIAIQGHTDNQGFKGVKSAAENEQRNQQLSLDRANAVYSYLVGKGVRTAQVKAVEGYGQYAPIASNTTAAGREQNRRVEVYLYASQTMIKAAENGTLK